MTQFMLCVILVIASFAQSASIHWALCMSQTQEWYAGTEALRIAENFLLYQRSGGGWPKNIDMAAPLSNSDRRRLERKVEN